MIDRNVMHAAFRGWSNGQSSSDMADHSFVDASLCAMVLGHEPAITAFTPNHFLVGHPRY